MKAVTFSAEPTNVIMNAKSIESIDLLKDSGRSRGGLTLTEGQQIQFPTEIVPGMFCVSTYRDNPVYYVKVAISTNDNVELKWAAIGQFRRRPYDLEDIRKYSLNYQLATCENDFELMNLLKGKTLEVTEIAQLDYLAFNGGKAVYEVITDENGKNIQRPVFSKRSTPIFNEVK